jgi:hypothetical protein
MSADSSAPRHDIVLNYDSENRLVDVTQVTKDDTSISTNWEENRAAISTN